MILLIYFHAIVVLEMEGVTKKSNFNGEEYSTCMYQIFWTMI